MNVVVRDRHASVTALYENAAIRYEGEVAIITDSDGDEHRYHTRSFSIHTTQNRLRWSDAWWERNWGCFLVGGLAALVALVLWLSVRG